MAKLKNKWSYNKQNSTVEIPSYNYYDLNNSDNLNTIEETKETITKNEKEILKSFSETIARKYITTSKLNMRQAADLSANIITVIPKDAEVLCEGYFINDWFYVKFNNYEGFCLKKYLK